MNRKDTRKAREEGETITGGWVSPKPNGGLQVELPDYDDMAKAEVPHPRPWTKLKRNKKTRIALMGISKGILDKADPAYARAMQNANSYRKVRAAELSTMHGCITSGSSALLASAGLALAASRFLYEKFAVDGGGDMGYQMLALAAKLGDNARMSELAAWEMSAREGAARRRLEAAKEGLPWLQPDMGTTKAGRKTNAERQQRNVEVDQSIPLPSQKGMTIDEVLVRAGGDGKDGLEHYRRSKIQELFGVQGHAGEPDVSPGAVYGAVPEDSGAEAAIGGEGGDDKQAASGGVPHQSGGSQSDPG